MKILTIVGARPQFIKAAPVAKALRKAAIAEVLVHTGQHYDDNMSAVFFRDLDLPQPDHNLNIGSGPHGWQTGQMLIAIEKVLQDEKPDWVLVYGDTNSTLAGALAAVKLHIPLAHVEAGLRSFNREMPEEHNRVLTDHCADLLFCPTQTAVDNLARENITQNVHLVGDTMLDAVLHYSKIAQQRSTILQELGLTPKRYLLATLHRPYNVDVADNLRAILDALAEAGEPVVFPTHPRTRQRIDHLIQEQHYKINGQLRLIEPLSYLDMLMLEQHARMILTDSGGIQKEAYFYSVPCVTLRPETEWVETLEAGWNVVVDAYTNRFVNIIHDFVPPLDHPPQFGDGQATERVIGLLTKGHHS